MREASTTSLTHHLAKALIPQKCPVPAFECYDGSSDPAAHLRYYNRILARWEKNDAVLCRYFPSSLKVSTLSWFGNLPPNSIDSYIQLTERFLRTYMYNKAVNAGMDKLFSLAIAYKEAIREYTDKCHKICQSIGNVDPVVSINCYKWGLDRMSPLFVEIHGSVPNTEGDLRIIIEKHARLEKNQRENPRAQTQISHRTNSEQVSRSKRGNSAELPRGDSIGQIDDLRRDDRKFEDQVFTKLNTNHTRVLREIKDREGLEWPWSKGKQPPRTEKSRDYCDLKQYIQKADNEDRNKRSKQVQLPEGNQTVNTISCSEATGPSLTAQIGKRLSK
ncbi:uncharacterized protein LOC113272492 [Papaver somniferum]|uniref:uncharacterized protein LOC113272492 n=1 Tax=Papaver somniferum TaxID=3469 RepID=UPI000E6F6B6C|nr:uncharacterized protein LOC113272492 [Papaver somniferum]